MMKKTYLIDNHTHLNMRPLYDDWRKYAQICKEYHMFLNLASSCPLDVERALEIAKETRIAKVWMAIHPIDIRAYKMDVVQEVFDKFYADNKEWILGIGECGLDEKDMEHFPPIDEQIAWLKWHANYANNKNLPIMIHCRDAYQTLIDHWDEFNFKTQVVIHCFSGTREEMVALLNRGCYISFAGNVTYPKVAVYTDDAIRSVPLDKILVETDAPFLVPRKLQKYTNVNQPYYIFETYEYIAKLKGIKVGVLVDKVAENYLTAYKLTEHDIAY